MKRPMMDSGKDFNSTLFASIVSSLSPAQTLGRAKVFCKILGPAIVFCEKAESSLSLDCLKVQRKPFHSSNESSMSFS